jgi:DNA mismatch repair protein MutS
MDFELDKQTIKDLEIFGNGRSINSILNFYNQTKTIGGKSFLQHLMANPVADRNELRQRIELIQTLMDSGLDLQINSSQFDLIEHYARLDRDPLKNNVIIAFFQHLSYRFRPRNDYYVIRLRLLPTETIKLRMEELLLKQTVKKISPDRESLMLKFPEDKDQLFGKHFFN